MQPFSSILFVCTGNIFRSMIAEYALKSLVKPELHQYIGSAGTSAAFQVIRPALLELLSKRGITPRNHRQRKLSQEMFQTYDLVVAMAHSHQDYIKAVFGCEVPLFKEVCFGVKESVQDVDEAVTD